ncbi:MAG: hypothetical protein LBF67_06985 [Prevotellaceae bacterium]|jgi:hypothetical protein|nr:hypothetical protein [Prevotellaceae bacterium]
MMKIVKHTITVVLCLLVTGGAVGVRFYVSACTRSGDVQLAMGKDHRSCCEHSDAGDAPGAPHKDGYFVAHEEECCKTSSLSVSVSSFEASQASKLQADFPVIFIPNLPRYADVAGCGSYLLTTAHAPLIADADPVPIIYLHGQLRL